jgi:hypothetical protein
MWETDVGSRHAGHHQVDDRGIEIAKENTESVQDGVVHIKAIDRDMVDREMKEMSDQQRFVTQLVTGLLFGNTCAILAVCICQAYAHKQQSAKQTQPATIKLNPGLAAAQELLGDFARSTAEDVARKTSCDGLSDADPAEPLVSRTNSGLVPDAGIVGDSSKDAPSTPRIRRQKTEMCRFEKGNDSPTSTTGAGVAAPERLGPCRTVDALCIPGRPRCVKP